MLTSMSNQVFKLPLVCSSSKDQTDKTAFMNGIEGYLQIVLPTPPQVCHLGLQQAFWWTQSGNQAQKLVKQTAFMQKKKKQKCLAHPQNKDKQIVHGIIYLISSMFGLQCSIETPIALPLNPQFYTHFCLSDALSQHSNIPTVPD